jgi:ABC-type dipeptide/oligopeptide/nickel transport system permease subunit
VEYGLFSGFFMNKFARRNKMTIDIFLIFCHDILAMILFRILANSKGVHVLVF